MVLLPWPLTNTHCLPESPLTHSLALLIPAAQSVTADYNPAERRGRAFGLLHLTGALGALIGAVFATNVGGVRPLGVEGWSFAFGSVALASWAIGAATLALGVDPRYSQDTRYRWDGAWEGVEGASHAPLDAAGSVPGCVLLAMRS